MQIGRTHSRWSLPRGRVLHRALRSDPTQEYLAYVPASAAPGAPVLVAVHGISRNVHEQTAVFATLAEDHAAVLLAPIFTEDQHQDYQRLGRRHRGSRVDLLLHRLLKEVALLSGADASQFHLFGFSAGAQFAHRYLMAHPHRVAGAVVAAAGWYTFPDHGRKYPYGIRPGRSLEAVSFNPEQFLRVPVTVIIGARDVGSSNLRRSERLDAQQGVNRVERARNWVAAMRDAAEAYGFSPATTLVEVPDLDHSFTVFCERGALVARVGSALFGVPPLESGMHSPIVRVAAERVSTERSVAEASV